MCRGLQAACRRCHVTGASLWPPIRPMGAATSSRTRSSPLPERHKSFPSTSMLRRNNRFHPRCEPIGCALPARLTRRCFWSDAPNAATVPRSVRTGRFRFIRRTGPRSFLRIGCRAISVRMCPVLQPVRLKRCSPSKGASRYEWVSRLYRTESARQGRGAMPAHRNVPRMPYRWTSIDRKSVV